MLVKTPALFLNGKPTEYNSRTFNKNLKQVIFTSYDILIFYIDKGD